MCETARALSLAIDRELASARAALLFLLVSPRLRAGDLEEFHRQVLDALSLRGSAIALEEPSGRELFNTQRQTGAGRPQADEIQIVKEVAQTGRPVISDLFRGSVSQPT